MEDNNENNTCNKQLMSVLNFLSSSNFKGFSISLVSNHFTLTEKGETSRKEHVETYFNSDSLDLKEICMLINATKINLSEILEKAIETFGEENVEKKMSETSGTMKFDIVYGTLKDKE